jgi:hypothetical protein
LRNPKWRIFTNPPGRAWRRNLLINSDGLEGQDLLLIAVGVVFPPEEDLIILNADDPVGTKK